jgi:hypothetical protein
VCAAFKVAAFPDSSIYEQLDQLREVRIALIHHSGSIASLPASMLALGEDGLAKLGLQKYTDLQDEFFIPTSEFLIRNFELVQSYLIALSERVYHAAHPTPLEDGDG